MSWLTNSAIVVGGVTMVAGGFAVAGGLLYLAARFAGTYCWKAWRNLSSVYMLHTMEYWFKRMDEKGTHILRKEHEAKLFGAAPTPPGEGARTEAMEQGRED